MQPRLFATAVSCILLSVAATPASALLRSTNDASQATAPVTQNALTDFADILQPGASCGLSDLQAAATVANVVDADWGDQVLAVEAMRRLVAGRMLETDGVEAPLAASATPSSPSSFEDEEEALASGANSLFKPFRTPYTVDAYRAVAARADWIARNANPDDVNLLATDAAKAAFPNVAAVDQVPSPVLAMLALTAAPEGPQTPFHYTSGGAQWLSTLQARYDRLTDSILAAMASSAPSFVPSSGPDNAKVDATAPLRFERALVGIALLEMATYHANSKGNLGNSVGYLTNLALFNQIDLGVYLGHVVENFPGDTVACSDVLKLAAEAVQAFNVLLALLVQIDVTDLPFIQNIFGLIEGKWYDELVPVDAAWGTVTQTYNSANDAAEIVEDFLAGQSIPMTLYHAAFLVGAGVVTKVATSVPAGAATTEAAAAEWSVEIHQQEASQTSHSWTVAGLISMNEGVLVHSVQSPNLFAEEGTIWQDTRMDYLLGLVEQELPHTEYEPTNSWQCAVASFGNGLQWGGAIVTVAGGAVAAYTWWTGKGAVVGGAMMATGGVLMALGWMVEESMGEDPCKKAVHHAGFYHETGSFINYWGDFGWVGDGLSVAGGLVTISGSADMDVLTEFMEPLPYDNAPDIYGYNEGKSYADALRAATEAAAALKLAEFRPIAATKGDAHITITFLCEGVGTLYDSYLRTPIVPSSPAVDAASSVCLEVLVGSGAFGNLVTSERGGVAYHQEGLANTGYVSVNGQTTNSPVVVNSDGSGVNES